MNRIITISRQFASGGHTIGKAVARRLGIPCYDEELISAVADESGLTEKYLREQGESLSGGLGALLKRQDREDAAMRSYIWDLQRDTILDLAQRRSCVIVGRGADVILRERADLLRVYIHADDDFRLRRIREEYPERPGTPEKRLRQMDERRRAWYEFFTGQSWGEAANYHITLNSGALGWDRCVDILCECY